MSKIVLLTRNNCPKCHALMLGLEHKLDEAELSNIEQVNKEDSREVYDELAEKYNLKSLPAVISGDRALVNPTVSIVKMLMKQ